MSKNVWDLHKEILGFETQSNQDEIKKLAQDGLTAIELNSAALQENATINDKKQSIFAVRLKTKECKLTAQTGDEFFAGDIVNVFSEKWIIYETYMDECDILRGKAFLCNHLFRFQNGDNPTIIERYGVIDDGSYSSGDNKQIPMETGYYKIYMPLDDDTKKIFKDKRFAIGIDYDKDANKILSVIKVSWIDKKSYNTGEGSHLLVLRAERDQYQKDKDSINESMCDFIETDENPEDPEIPEEPTDKASCVIVGKDELRLGTSRDYEVTVQDADGNNVDITGKTFEWTYNDITGVKYTINDNTTLLTIAVPMNASLYGEVINISVIDTANEFINGIKNVEVV